MKLFISFSARNEGNCDEIARTLATDEDKIIYFRNLNIHSCINCSYECFSNKCKYRDDDIYNLYEAMTDYQKVILIVPIYSGNPASLYYIFDERGQDYFTHNEGNYENIVKRLFIIGIYGGKEENPDFISCFEKWFEGTKYFNHVLGIERHKYNLQLKDSVLNIEDIRKEINEFVNPTNATEELSAMAVVLCDENILVTKELIYGREVLSLPKGHKEENEALIDTAIRECFEETNIIITKNSFIKELEPFSYEFLTPSNKLIRKKSFHFFLRLMIKECL